MLGAIVIAIERSACRTGRRCIDAGGDGRLAVRRRRHRRRRRSPRCATPSYASSSPSLPAPPSVASAEVAVVLVVIIIVVRRLFLHKLPGRMAASRRARRWATVTVVVAAVWIALLADAVPGVGPLAPSGRSVLLALPAYALVAFGAWSMAVVGARLATFNDCDAAAAELRQARAAPPPPPPAQTAVATLTVRSPRAGHRAGEARLAPTRPRAIAVVGDGARGSVHPHARRNGCALTRIQRRIDHRPIVDPRGARLRYHPGQRVLAKVLVERALRLAR